MPRLNRPGRSHRAATSVAALLVVMMGAAACSGQAAETQSAPTTSRTTRTPVAVATTPITCRDTEPQRSGQWSTTELASLLEGQSNTDAKAMLQGIRGMSFQPDAAEDAIREWLFTAKDQAAAKASTARVINGFSGNCSLTVVDDLDDLVSEIPTFDGSKITHADDTFGFCPGVDDIHELGWIKLTRVYSCKNELVSIDFSNRTIRHTTIRTGKNSKLTSFGVTGGRIVWITSTMHPASGLNKPTFDAALHSSDAGLQNHAESVMYSSFSSGTDPSPEVAWAQEGFVYITASASEYQGAHSRSLWNISGDTATEVSSSNWPKSDPEFTNLKFDMAMRGLMPLYAAKYSESFPNTYSVYFDTVNRKLLKGVDITASDGGCGTIGVGFSVDPDSVSRTSDISPIDRPTFLATSLKENPVGVIIKNDGIHAKNSQGEISTVATTGVVLSSGFASGQPVHYLERYDGGASWSIDQSVATLEYSVLGRMRMRNSSGSIVYVNPNTGKEDTGLSAEALKTLRALDKTDPSTAHAPLTVWDHADPTTILANDGYGDVYVLSRKEFCALGAVPAGARDVSGLLSKSY